MKTSGTVFGHCLPKIHLESLCKQAKQEKIDKPLSTFTNSLKRKYKSVRSVIIQLNLI